MNRESVIDPISLSVIQTMEMPPMLTMDERNKAIKDAEDMAKKILDSVV